MRVGTLCSAIGGFEIAAVSLGWPVTENESGRVAKLRAVGNAVVPAWVLAGPFAYIQAREAQR